MTPIVIVLTLALFAFPGPGCPEWDRLAEQAAAQWGAPLHVVRAMIYVESYCDWQAVGPNGARGLLQVMPGTALYVEALTGIPADLILADPEANVAAGAFYFSIWWRRFGRLDLALSAYNGGPAHVIDSLEVWPPTRRYVDKVFGILGNGWRRGLEPVICARRGEACLLRFDK